MSENSERQSNHVSRLLLVARTGKRILPPETVQVLADEVVVRLASRLRENQPRLDVSTEAICDALLSADAGSAQKIIDQERRDGVPVDVVYLHTLSEAAKHLGELWTRDEVSFLSMTVALGRIFEIMRGLRQETPVPSFDPRRSKRAFFASVPDEIHTLGVTVAASVMRNNGWDIELRTGLAHDALVEVIASDTHDIIGLSAGRHESVVALVRLVVALRIVKPGAKIIVCGQVVNQVPGLADLVDADGVIGDGDDALAILEGLVEG